MPSGVAESNHGVFLYRDKKVRPLDHLSIPQELSPECSLEGLMLKLKLQYFGHVMQKADSLEKTLMLGKIKGRRRRGRQRMRWLDAITDSIQVVHCKVDEHILTHHNHSKSIVCCRVHFWHCTFLKK